ncbi:MAG: FtsX-like permease family protein [Methylovirgula sp.]
MQVLVAGALIENMNKQMQIYSALLLAIGAISLVISGIGIMNVMLMSVMERKEEIGIRAAVGASPNAIRAMFLMESVALAAGGASSAFFSGLQLGGYSRCVRAGILL